MSAAAAGARRLAVCVGNDVRLQVRHGLYSVYAVICLMYVLILRSVTPAARAALLPLLVFVDPTMLGFFFVGGIVLLERTDRTLSGFFTTPAGVSHYFTAKVLSLSLLAALAGEAIALLSVGTAYRPLLLAGAVILASAIFTLIGLAAVTRFRTVNGYLMGSVLYMLPFALPVAGYFGWFLTPLTYVIPSRGALDLVAASFSPAPVTPQVWMPALFSQLAWLAGAGLWARRWFARYVIRSIGEV